MTDQTGSALPESQPASFGRLVVAAAMALGISLLCLLPPIIHFCSGPLGPAIGGYVAGTRLKAEPAQGVLVGLLMGLFSAVPVVIALVVSAANPDLLPIPSTTRDLLPLFGLVLLAWMMGLGMVGAVVGGNLARENERQEPVK